MFVDRGPTLKAFTINENLAQTNFAMVDQVGYLLEPTVGNERYDIVVGPADLVMNTGRFQYIHVDLKKVAIDVESTSVRSAYPFWQLRGMTLNQVFPLIQRDAIGSRR